MEGKDCHYYPCGPSHIPASSPLSSASCFITPHHPKRRFEDIWAIPHTLTGKDGHPVFHSIINRSDGSTSNHRAPDEDLPLPDAPVDYDDPFPDQPSRALDIRGFHLSQHLKGKWYNALQKASATDPLLDIVSTYPKYPGWILVDRLLLKRGEDDSRDCLYVPYEAAHEGDNIRSEILPITHEQMAHMGAHKWFKYAYRHFYWMTMRSDFKDYICWCHLYQMIKQPTTLPDGIVTPLPVPREPFSSIAINFAGPFPSYNKKELILVLLDRFTGSATSSQFLKTSQQSKLLTSSLKESSLFTVAPPLSSLTETPGSAPAFGNSFWPTSKSISTWLPLTITRPMAKQNAESGLFANAYATMLTTKEPHGLTTFLMSKQQSMPPLESPPAFHPSNLSLAEPSTFFQLLKFSLPRSPLLMT